MEEPKKIGATEWIIIRSHARALYLPLATDLIRAFGLEKGDLLEVEIRAVQKRRGGEEHE